MKELLDKLLAEIPRYARRFVDLLTSPKRFVAQLDLDSEVAVQDAFTFLAVTFGLAYIVQIPLLATSQNKEAMFGASAVLTAMGFVLSVAVLALSWRLVGGHPNFRKIVIYSCYFSSVSTIIWLGFTLMGIAVFKGFDPAMAGPVFGGGTPDAVDLTKSTGYMWFLALVGFGMLAVYVWIFWIWGAYRNLTQVSQLRSAAAFVVFFVLGVVSLLLQILMAGSMSPAPKTVFPAALVGSWEASNQRSAGGLLTTEIADYHFDSTGNYVVVASKGANNGHCVNFEADDSWGHATVEGSTLTLHVQTHKHVIDDSCSHTKLETPGATENQMYQYVLQQKSEGQSLCLTGRFGELCLTPKHS
jgi:hypothetical protein